MEFSHICFYAASSCSIPFLFNTSKLNNYISHVPLFTFILFHRPLTHPGLPPTKVAL